MTQQPYVSRWLAPGDRAAVESLALAALAALGGRAAETRDDMLFDGKVVVHMEAHVVPNAQKHPAMTAHLDFGAGPTEITTGVSLSLVARHDHEATSTRFINRCIEISTSVQEATGSVPEPA